jgi:uncharacterized protein (TIGR03435 family)
MYVYPNGKRRIVMPQYVLLLHSDGEAWKKLSPEEMQKKVEKYLAWRNKPFVVAGAGLVRDTGRVIRAKGDGVSVTEGPFSESAEVMGGFYTNRTGLGKNYDFKLSFAPDLPNIPREKLPGDLQDRPLLFDALREQLGLKLQAQKGPVEYYVVDHVEKPSAN